MAQQLEYRVVSRTYSARFRLKSNDLLERSEAETQRILDVMSTDRWRLVSTDTAMTQGNTLYIYLYFERERAA